MKASIIADPVAALRHARQLVDSDPKAAAKQAQRLLESHPGDPAVLRVLGAALRKLGRTTEAARFEGEAVQASIRQPAHREAARAIATGDKMRAVAILESIIARDETDVVALVMLGLQLSTDSELDMADPLLRKAVELAPEDMSARMALTEHLQRSRHASEALEVLDKLDANAAKAANVQSLRASILRDLGRQEEEVAILEGLCASEKVYVENYRIRLGHAYRNLGRIDDAVASYRNVIAGAPHEGTSWWSLANLKSAKFDDSDIATMEKALTGPGAAGINGIRLHFALGKAYEDRKDIERSFQHYDAGNRLKNASTTYNPQRIETWVDEAEADYDEKFLEPGENPNLTDGPIFVIGIQRSGSTLVEQILDSHPQIEGTAELTEIPSLVRQQGDIAHRREIPFNEHLRRMSDGELRAMADRYVDRTQVYRLTDKPHFTDKMPNNWIYAGIIRKILPNARIVDVRRHPLDCCFSNWKQLYGRGLEHSYSMENMGRYYADYVRLMRLMDRVQPGKIHRVIYEHLVDDTEGEVRRLLDYLGLPFDDACLNFHANERSVRTISAEQVRQPINRRGIGQWKPYEQWLGPMKEALGSTLTDWDK